MCALSICAFSIHALSICASSICSYSICALSICAFSIRAFVRFCFWFCICFWICWFQGHMDMAVCSNAFLRWSNAQRRQHSTANWSPTNGTVDKLSIGPMSNAKCQRPEAKGQRPKAKGQRPKAKGQMPNWSFATNATTFTTNPPTNQQIEDLCTTAISGLLGCWHGQEERLCWTRSHRIDNSQ